MNRSIGRHSVSPKPINMTRKQAINNLHYELKLLYNLQKICGITPCIIQNKKGEYDIKISKKDNLFPILNFILCAVFMWRIIHYEIYVVEINEFGIKNTIITKLISLVIYLNPILFIVFHLLNFIFFRKAYYQFLIELGNIKNDINKLTKKKICNTKYFIYKMIIFCATLNGIEIFMSLYFDEFIDIPKLMDLISNLYIYLHHTTFHLFNCVFFNEIKYLYKALNDTLENIYNKGTYSQRTTNIIKICLDYHASLCSIGKKLDKYSSLNNIHRIVISFTVSSVSLFFCALLIFRKDPEISDVAIMVYWYCSGFLQISITIYLICAVHNEANKTKFILSNILRQIKTHTLSSMMVETKALELYHNKVQFSANGFLALDGTFAYAYCAGTVYYTILLYQTNTEEK